MDNGFNKWMNSLTGVTDGLHFVDVVIVDNGIETDVQLVQQRDNLPIKQGFLIQAVN